MNNKKRIFEIDGRAAFHWELSSLDLVLITCSYFAYNISILIWIFISIEIF